MNNYRNLKTRTLAYVILLLSTQLFGLGKTLAQLNGTYTIGSSGPNNFAGFVAAVSALTSNGVNGAVTFMVSPGTYNEQISISSVSGTSVSNTVTFKSSNGDSSSVILSFASATNMNNNYVVELNGADYVIFKQITLQRTGTNNYSQVINISNSSTYNKFHGNRIIGSPVTTSSTYKSLVYSNNGIMGSNNLFIDNRFENGSYGVYCIGQGSNNLDSGTEVKSNHFVNQYYCGVYLAYQDSPEINLNVFHSVF